MRPVIRPRSASLTALSVLLACTVAGCGGSSPTTSGGTGASAGAGAGGGDESTGATGGSDENTGGSEENTGGSDENTGGSEDNAGGGGQGAGGNAGTGGSSTAGTGAGATAGSGGTEPSTADGGVATPECPAGMQDNDLDGACAPDCFNAYGGPLLDCGFMGSCDSSTGTASCACVLGYAGDTCRTCADGYQDEKGLGLCHLACDTTLDCGANGSCTIGEDGLRVCECAPGYAGDTCANPFEPSSTQLTLWLDSSAIGSLSSSGASVITWKDRRGGTYPALTQGTAASRPTMNNTGLNGMRTVVFDGTDDKLDTSGHFPTLAGDSYTILVAAAPVNSSTFPQFVLHARYASQPSRGVGFGRLSSSTYRLRYSADANIGSDLLNLTGFALETEPKVFAVRRDWNEVAPSLYFAASDNSTLAAQATTLSPVAQPTLQSVIQNDALILSVGDGTFQGHLAEVLVYGRVLDDAEMMHVQAYLANKWGI